MLNNRMVQIILAVLIVFALLALLRFTFHASVGSEGIEAGVTRGSQP